MAGTELAIKKFATSKVFEEWLAKNHGTTAGVWLQFYKKSSGIKGLVYTEALDVALCYGWIDSQSKSIDAESYIQKFTPRGKHSIWSKVNREHITRLIKTGRMSAAGLTQIDAAKKDGRWEQAYDSPRTMEMPADFLKALEKNKKAQAFFQSLNRANTYAIGWRLQTAKKPKTRAKRMQAILAMLERSQKFH